MNFAKITVAILMGLFSACYGITSLWTSCAEAADSNRPVISVLVDGTVLTANSANSVNLPAIITFKANKPVTIYYTTDGTAPTTSSSMIGIIDVTEGPTINSIDAVLTTFGEDAEGSLSYVQSYSFYTP